MSEYTAQDFKKGQPRWCPGCGEVLASNKELANLTVREWLCDEMEAHHVKIFKSQIFVDGVLRFGNFKAELLVA